MSSCIYDSWSKPKYIYFGSFHLHISHNFCLSIFFVFMLFLYYTLYYTWTESKWFSKPWHYNIMSNKIAFAIPSYNIFTFYTYTNVSCYMCSRSSTEHWRWPLTWFSLAFSLSLSLSLFNAQMSLKAQSLQIWIQVGMYLTVFLTVLPSVLAAHVKNKHYNTIYLKYSSFQRFVYTFSFGRHIFPMSVQGSKWALRALLTFWSYPL